MYQVEDEPVERLYLYVVRDDDKPPSVLPIALSILSLLLVITVGVLFPYRTPLVRETVKTPAILLPLETFTATEQVIPTGIQTFPATYATGVLTITNGSVIAQHLPKGMILTGSDGTQVITTESIAVPASNGVSFGVAYVRAQAVLAGEKGNLAVLDINLVYGTSLYIKNYWNFTGGKESYSIRILTKFDTNRALSEARQSLTHEVTHHGLRSNCWEKSTGVGLLTVAWTCQFVTYQVSWKILAATVSGKFVVVVVERPVKRQVIVTK